MTRYLVTGATGFIGGHLCNLLVERGDEVTALVRTPAKAKKLPSAVKTLAGDLTLFEDEQVALPEVDVVVHLAGVVAAPTAEQYEAINYTAVVNLVACLERQSWTPRRLVFSSSLAAAGPSPADRAWTEADTPRPIDAYGDAKARAEKAVAEASFPTTSFRPPLVFGEGDPATLTIFKAAKSRFGLRVSGPPQKLSYVDVRDLCDAIVRMSEDTREGHHLYFSGYPEPMDTDVLWRTMGEAFGHRVLTPHVPRPALYAAMRVATTANRFIPFTNQLDEKQHAQLTAPGFVCDSSALREELGWSPERDLSIALRDALAGYRRLGQL